QGAAVPHARRRGLLSGLRGHPGAPAAGCRRGPGPQSRNVRGGSSGARRRGGDRALSRGRLAQRPEAQAPQDGRGADRPRSGRRLLHGNQVLRVQWPARFAALATRIDRYEAALAAAGLDPRQLAPRSFTLPRVARYVAKAGAVLLLLLPAALVGLVANYPAYR